VIHNVSSVVEVYCLVVLDGAKNLSWSKLIKTHCRENISSSEKNVIGTKMIIFDNCEK
jgi:hypothetical protein